MNVKSGADFVVGLFFALVGLGAVLIALRYPFGTAARMGPGFFPLVLGGLLILSGAALALRSLKVADPDGATTISEELAAARPLFFVSLALLAFALLVRPIGLAAATVILVLIASRAERGFPILYAFVLSLSLATLAVAIFVHGLGLPFRVWP